MHDDLGTQRHALKPPLVACTGGSGDAALLRSVMVLEQVLLACGTDSTHRVHGA